MRSFLLNFSGYKILERIGSIAYKLELPNDTSIHPIFHVSQLKKLVGEHTNIQPTIQYVNENYEWKAKPEEVLGYQKNKAGSWEVLLCWEGLPRHEATWEIYEDMQWLYPDLHLEDKVIPMAATDNYKLVEELIDHMSGIDEKQLVLYAQMGTLVNLILQWPEMNVKEIAVNFSKLACNAHTICDSELRPLGTGLYPVISIINHSCLPNAVLVFEGRSAVVRAVQHIPPGAEVSISYIETAGSTMTRQKTLKENYLFTCTCSRCVKAQEDEIKESAILEGYRCTNDQCAGFLLRNSDDTGFTCQQCGLVRSKEDIKNIASQIKSISDEASTSMSSQNYAEALFMHEKVEKLQKILCHPYSISLMQTREKLLKISMELENWTKALTYCKLTISVYQKLYPGIHPLLGLQFYTCGKLEWLLGHTEDSLKSYTKAFDILRITHGTNSSFMKELLQKLEEARAEASYKRSSIDDE
ncbi:histone-lysine N-methyltransferase ASHR1 isoform X5 [Cucumis melo var. makuwa]|uniref:Histone-lysine N-methyltransferase ASHR1 isoform X5 n=1 Tax=Cucumis melo var. makuwa TaxID=1194695 RepID=A0A5D3DSW1_CUCMM|nr:histone-lysine N-methyltransferase ASHR1 isoform X5 [Cucumis melo var. makuwa]